MRLKSLKITGFKSFAKPTTLEFPGLVSAIVGPNGSGKSNIAEAVAWVLGEQSFKNLRGKRGEDFIFNGSSGASRMSKASAVLTFSDLKEGDEVSLSRVVYRDGTNEYFINNQARRLKDVVEFLSKVGGGSLRHHIISQGEVDRILSASLKERREMIEDALGLRIHQLKKEEGKRKLQKTEENIKQVTSLRREIQPHLRFLKKQVDRANESLALKEKLRNLCSSYFSKATARFKKDTERVVQQKESVKSDFFRDEKEVKQKKIRLSELGEERAKSEKIREKVNELEREIGRYEGMLSQVKKQTENTSDSEETDAVLPVDFKEMRSFIDFLEEKIEDALIEKDIGEIKNVLKEIKAKIDSFLKKDSSNKGKNVKTARAGVSAKDLADMETKYKELLDALRLAKEEELAAEEESRESLETEREVHYAEMKLSELRNRIDSLEAKEHEIKSRHNVAQNDLEEAEAILGEKIKIQNADSLDDSEMEKERRFIERIKIKIEESGNVGEEMIKEYEEIKSRDDFLSSEIVDLEKSVVSLRGLIKQLDEQLNSGFKNGILKINKEFQKIFELMFGGGSAEIKIKNQKLKTKNDDENLIEEAEEEQQIKEGVEISVKLPRKRIHSLDMLSGGERALTSIALLFAVSQVNPPPFLVLDETDAALDESNSRKYAKILGDLSKQTQLILITHNRETMNIAEILYGVTMGSDGISRLLSIKLDQAEELVEPATSARQN
jgi:chromosome segregation protein